MQLADSMSTALKFLTLTATHGLFYQTKLMVKLLTPEHLSFIESKSIKLMKSFSKDDSKEASGLMVPLIL